MGRFGPTTAQFYAPGDLSTALSDGSATTRVAVRSWSTDFDSAIGEAGLTFINDTGLNTLAAVGNVCWAYKTDTLRSDLSGNKVTFAEPFIIRSRVAGPAPNELTISGPSLLNDLSRWTIYRPLGLEVITNTTLDEAVGAPITSRTVGIGAPRGNDTMQIDGVTEDDVGREIRIELDNGATFVTVVVNYVFWEEQTHLQFRDRLTYDASPGNSLEFRDRLIKPVNFDPFLQGAEVTVTLNSGSFITIVDQAAAEDGIVTLRDGITGAANVGNAVQCRDYSQKSTTDVTQVMAYASGWSVEFQTGTGTEDGTRYPGGGETVYDVLRGIAEETGELFRLKSAEATTMGPKRTVIWRRTPDAVGVSGTLRLVMPASQSAMATDTADKNRAILIERPSHAGEYDPVTQVIPIAGDSRVTLFSCSPEAVTAAATAGYTVVTTGLGLYAAPYVVHSALNTSIGIYQRKVTFSEVTVEGDNVLSIQSAADRLLNLSIKYLEEHTATSKVIRASCISAVGIRAGQTVELYYQSPTGEYTIDYTGASVLYVQSVRRESSPDGAYPGAPVSHLELTPTRAPAPSPTREIGRRLATIDRLATRVSAPQLVNMATFTNTSTGGYVPPTPAPVTGDYLPLAGGQMTGNITFSGSQTVDGVDISAHAADPDAHHAAVTVGNTGLQLAGSQVLSLQLATDPALEISSGVRVKLPTNSGLVRDSTGLYLSPGTITASTGNAVSGSLHYHSVTDTDNALTTPSTLLSGSATGGLTLAALGVGDTVTTSAALYVKAQAVDDYTLYLKQLSGQTASMLRVESTAGQALIVLTSGGDLESGNPAFVSGLTGWQITATGNAEFNNVSVRGELRVVTFVADEMHATGGTIAVMTATTVAPPVGANDNKLPASQGNTFTLNVVASRSTGLCYFSAGDILRVKHLGKVTSGAALNLYDVYLQVSAIGTHTGEDLENNEPGYYPMTVYWRHGGTTNLVLPTGAAVVRWGKVNQSGGTYTGGMILTSDLSQSPYIDIFTIAADQTGATWQSAPVTPKPRVRVGNLDGVLGLAEQWGIAAGTDLSDSSTASRHFVASDLGFRLQNVDIKLYSGSNPTVDIGYTGDVKFGTDTGDVSTTTFYHQASTGSVRMGPYVNGKPFLLWNNSTGVLGLYQRAGGVDTGMILFNSSGESYFNGPIAISTTGGIYQGTGTFSSPTTGLKIYNSSGIGRLATYSSGTLQVEINSTGKLVAGGGAVILENDGLHAYDTGLSSKVVHLSGTGIQIDSSTSSTDFSRAINYLTSGTRFASLLGVTSAGERRLIVEVESSSGSVNAVTEIQAVNTSTSQTVSVEAVAGADADNSYIRVDGDLYLLDGLRVGSQGVLNRGQIVSNLGGEHDNNALILQDTTDVAHGMTTIVATGTYGAMGKFAAADGGLAVIGATESVTGVALRGYGTGTSASEATTATGAILMDAYLKSGTGVTSFGSDDNLFSVRNNTATQFIVKGNGDFFYNGTGAAYDDYDDAALLAALNREAWGGAIDEAWGRFIAYNRQTLVDAGVMSEFGFINGAALNRLLVGAMGQLAARLHKLEETL